MENLIETIEKFLQYSDEKLEELSEKNNALRQGESEEEKD
ncbi:SP_0009 family protein [Streptococcus halotolerans]|nr:SP_0009 family protein [Streptococcus halotolerans]